MSEEPVKVTDRRWWARTVREDGGTVSDSDWAPDKPSYVQELEQQLAEKNQLLQEYISQYKQAQHEFDDARARMRKEVARDAEATRRAVFIDLLEVVDDLDLAVTAARQAGHDPQLLQGIELVREKFLHKLTTYNISRVDPLGQPFDPTCHEALTSLPVSEAFADGVVAGVIRPGYMMGPDVLRPAAVAVASEG